MKVAHGYGNMVNIRFADDWCQISLSKNEVYKFAFKLSISTVNAYTYKWNINLRSTFNELKQLYIATA